MKLADTTKAAGVSEATFWVYFADKTEITTEVLKEFIDEMMSVAASDTANQSIYASIYNANLLWLRNTHVNGGLMRCLLQLSDEVTEFADVYNEADEELSRRIARS